MIFGSLELCIKDYIQYRLLAFWDKTAATETVVIATHAFIKKQSKVPDREIQKAIQLKGYYFEEQQAVNKKK